MRRLFISLLFIAACGGVLKSQESFMVSPQTVIVDVDEEIVDAVASNLITNLTDSTVTIKWTREVICKSPADGYSAVCDFNICYLPNVDSYQFTLEDNQEEPLSVHFYKNEGQQGAAIIALHLENLAVSTDTVTAFYLFNSCELSSSVEPLPEPGIQVLPNPASNHFQLSDADAVETIRVFNMYGREVRSYNVDSQNSYDLYGLSRGWYIIGCYDRYDRVFQALKLLKE